VVQGGGRWADGRWAGYAFSNVDPCHLTSQVSHPILMDRWGPLVACLSLSTFLFSFIILLPFEGFALFSVKICLIYWVSRDTLVVNGILFQLFLLNSAH
jgi:hypothetical protein